MPRQSRDAATRARAWWAEADFDRVRAVAGRAAGVAWPRTRTPTDAKVIELPGGRAMEVDGDLRIDPMSGVVFDGRRELSLGLRAERPSDVLVRAFPSLAREGHAAPLWHGRHADLQALICELLPRALLLEGVPEADDAVRLVSVRMGRLGAFQEAMRAGLFGTAPVRVQGWDRVVLAERATIPLLHETDGRLAGRVAERIGEAFGAWRQRNGPPVFLSRGGDRSARKRFANWSELNAALDRAGALRLDPGRETFGDIVMAVAAAEEVISADERDGWIQLLRGNKAHGDARGPLLDAVRSGPGRL